MQTRERQDNNTALTQHRVISELSRMLKARHWAQRMALFSRRAARNMMLGNSASRFRGRGMEFEEVRRYQPGDDIRTIDWKVSARAQGTYTKLFCEERERPCHIIVDQRSSLFFGSTIQFKSVLAAEIAAAIGWAALAGGDRVGGQVLGEFVERDTRAKRSKHAVLSLIHDIHQLNHQLLEPNQSQRSPDLSLANSLIECQRITRPGTALFVISDFYDFDAAAAKALSNLSKHADISLLHICDPLEERLPMSGNVAISDGWRSRRIGVSKNLQQRYLADRQEHLDALLKSVRQAKALYSKIETSVTAQRALMKLFGR